MAKRSWHQNVKRQRKPKGFQGYWAASKLEGSVLNILHLREKAGEIRDIQTQAVVTLVDGPRPIKHRVDFKYFDIEKDAWWTAEAKGYTGETWDLKYRLYLAGFGPYPLDIWKGSASNPRLVETVHPGIRKDTEKDLKTKMGG